MNVAQRIEKINREGRGIWGQCGVTSWERERLDDWSDAYSLTPKQEAILCQIEVKVFGEDYDHNEN